VSAGERHRGSSGPSAKPPARRAKCPICGKPRSNDFRPFCSKACADIDLGRWLGGRYAVPGELAHEDPDAEN
jgi:endogenous inhibitor of DNA gyrase (YacG/DUF329 family)